jgi:hypothetical protein
MTETNLAIPPILHQTHIHRDPLLLHLLPQNLRVTPRIAGDVTGLLHIRQQQYLHIRVFLEYGLEALPCGVDGASERRRGDQLDAIMVGEVVAEKATLFVSEVG